MLILLGKIPRNLPRWDLGCRMRSSALLVCLGWLAYLAASKKVEILSHTDAEQLKEVFFGGEPWLVQCASKADLAAAAAADGLGAHEVVELALPLLRESKFGLLDCARKLPSGKSTYDRFKLESSASPTLVLAANGKAPTQITAPMLNKYIGTSLFPTPRQQAGALASLVRARSEPKAYSFTKTEDVQAQCLTGKQKHCVLLLGPKEIKGEFARTVKKLMNEFRTITFATINTDRYEFSLAKHLPAAPADGSPQILALQVAK